ncbi:hypothetical protein HO133_007764 [Letharia lupina]|uniref:Uncharacterized protein n=1 Tax=Letharia lupina TaxID=560253 RepID=A0A8H6FH80_9LECA|nr:uncharacterized protein HO133_007764 [Letharia lupina]KAF6228036.1 hypothetical protein HO133_007764 [Letharia lupina]
MFNQHFGTDRTLESIELFIFKCDDRQFFDLTEQAQDYKRWCTPHPMSPIVPPSMVLGTAEWRTELRAFLVFQASNNVTLTDLKESFSATFPEESRTSGQISIQLAHINQQQRLVRQLEWFAATYRWHPSYVAPASATAAFEADAKAAARARLGQDKQQAKDYVDNEAALTAQLESLNQHSHSLAMSNTGNASASEELAIADQSTNQFGESVSGFDSPSATIIADFVEPFAANFSGSAISKILRQAFTEPAPGLTYDEALAIQTGLFAESARATSTAAPGSGAPAQLPSRSSHALEIDPGTLQGVLGAQAREDMIHGQREE